MIPGIIVFLFQSLLLSWSFARSSAVHLRSSLYALSAVTLLSASLVVASSRQGAYETIVAQLSGLEAAHTATVKTFAIGKNDEGTLIMGARVSLNPTSPDPSKVAHLIVATHHGNETHAPILAMQFLKNLAQRFESNEIYRGQLADTEWTIIPVLNVSGYNASNRYEHGFDPNRDYPGPCNAAPGGKLKSVRTLIEHMGSRVYAGTMTIHGYIGTLTYPWGVYLDDNHTLDHNQFDAVTAKAAKVNGYRYGTSTDIVYPALGTYEDYAYWKHGMWSILAELESGSASDISKTAEAMAVFFDGIDKNPSVQNQLTGHCQRVGQSDKLDLQNE